jgi:hypothetical protein
VSLVKNWENLGDTESIKDMAVLLVAHVTDSLTECLPITTVKIRYQQKIGILDKTKALITERDLMRKKMGTVKRTEKVVKHTKYNQLRNRENSEFKKDSINYNNDRIDKAKDENEVWKVVNDISNPTTSNKFTLLEGGKLIEYESKVADIFNDFFVNKIENLKKNKDKSFQEVPLSRIKAKKNPKNLHFHLKQSLKRRSTKQSVA